MHKLKDLALSDTGFVFDPYSGATFMANPVAVCMIEGLRKSLTRSEVVEEVGRRFELLGEDVARDLEELVQSMRTHGLLPAEYEVK